MASKVLSLLLPLLLLLSFYGAQAQNTIQGCFWTAYADNCDTVQCPRNTREVTRGTSGICPNSQRAGEICKKGQKKLCCNNISSRELQTCKWTGLSPTCTSDCPSGKTKLATDAWGGGSHCGIGCKSFCCDLG